MSTRTLIFLRHGKTKYTGQFPDLTSEGKKEIEGAADEVVEIVGNRKDVHIVSSSAPRALGTADIIAQRLGHLHDIEHEPAIRCMDFYDTEKANALWASFTGPRLVDVAYEVEDRFEEGVIIEKRSEIQRRFFDYVGTLFKRFIDGKLPEVMVNTSHYEVLWKLAQTIDPSEPLWHGEIIRLDLSQSVPGYTDVCGTFRGKQVVWHIQEPSEVFRRQFTGS